MNMRESIWGSISNKIEWFCGIILLPPWLSHEESTCNVGGIGDTGSIPGMGRSPGRGNGNPLQYSCLRNSMDRGTWRAVVQRVTKESDTTERLSTERQVTSFWGKGFSHISSFVKFWSKAVLWNFFLTWPFKELLNQRMSMIRRLKSQGCGPETPCLRLARYPRQRQYLGKSEKFPYSATSLSIISWIVSLIFFILIDVFFTYSEKGMYLQVSEIYKLHVSTWRAAPPSACTPSWHSLQTPPPHPG